MTGSQTITGGRQFILLEVDGTTYAYIPDEDITLKGGYAYTYKLSVAPDNLELEGSTITDWEDDESVSDVAKDMGYTYDEATNIYTVYTSDGLLAWNEAAQSNLTLNCTLAFNIDLTGIDWTPVGNSDNRYTGTFEGGGHTVTGLTVSGSETSYMGLIGYLGSGGKVQNLTLENADITGIRYVGGVVGYSAGTVTACYSTGSVLGSGSYVGGVVGYNADGTVTACYSTGSVSSYGSYVGGVVGYNADGTVTACYSTGSVSSYGSYVGGVVGYTRGGFVTACYHASGNISGNSRVGGVVGYNTNGTVTACYWSDYDGNGIGSGSGDATKVDGDWTDAVSTMNEAISTKNSEWKYEILTDSTLPTLTKNE